MENDFYNDDLWCKIYIDINLEEKEMIDLLKTVINDGKIEGRILSVQGADIFVRKNDLFDPNSERRNDPKRGFLSYRYSIEVEGYWNQDKQSHIDLIIKIMNYFILNSIRVVAVCDYEDKLPRYPKRENSV